MQILARKVQTVWNFPIVTQRARDIGRVKTVFFINFRLDLFDSGEFSRAHSRTQCKHMCERAIFSRDKSGKLVFPGDTRRQATAANGRENEPVNCTSLMTGLSVVRFSTSRK